MGKIDYQKIYSSKRDGWNELTKPGSKYENFFAGYYSENNHFVYELLQNAEDAEATFITFVYQRDRLTIYHNGRPFNEMDVNGICSVQDSAKDKDSLQTIGHFGIGFKSVFKYTSRPEVYSNGEAFAIENYLLPKELLHGNFPKDCCYQMGETTVFPFENEHNITKFVLPFKKNLASSGIDPEDIVKKLSGLEDEILLFLRHIKKLTWLDETTGEYGEYECKIDSKDGKICICRKSDNEGTEQESRYLVYEKYISTEEMKAACVKIAFKMGERRIEPIKLSKVWVFFPTTDESGLKFLAHGTYQTPISREKIVSDSTFNKELFRHTENLVIESLADLRERGLLTQAFLKEILLPSFSSAWMGELKKKATEAFMREKLLPAYRSSTYYCAREMRLAIPYNLPEIVREEQLSDAIGEKASFVAFNDINAAGSAEYYRWLQYDLKLTKWTLTDFSELLSGENLDEFGGCRTIFEFLMSLPDVDKERGFQSGYWSDLKNCMKGNGRTRSPWDILRQKPILPNRSGTLSAAWIGEKRNLYLQDEMGEHYLSAEKYVDLSAMLMQNQNDEPNAKASEEDENCLKKLLKNHFWLEFYDHKQYVKEEICPKYKNENPTVTDDEHLEDLHQILKLKYSEMPPDLLCYCFIRAVDGETANGIRYCYPKDRNLYIDNQPNISLKNYFRGVSKKYFVDLKFYQAHGIEVEDLKKLGINDSIVIGLEQKGTCDQLPSAITCLDGRSTWKCEEKFCCKLKLTDLKNVLSYIADNQNSGNAGNAKEKSKIIFKLLQQNSEKLHGKIYFSDGTDDTLDCVAIQYLNQIPWLFTEDNRLVSSVNVSQYDLDRRLYEELPYNSPLFKCLKFKIDSRDQKKILMEFIPKWTGDDLRDLEQAVRDERKRRGECEERADYHNEDWEFPYRKILNLDRLRRHVREEFACAELVRYERVPRSIRTTQNSIDPRSYLKSLYEESNQYGCQLCYKPFFNFEAVEIEKKPERELEQMYLCLCHNCAEKYRSLREDSTCIEQMKEKIRAWTTTPPEYIQLNDELTLRFVPVHLAEIQTLLKCMEEETEEVCIGPLDI